MNENEKIPGIDYSRGQNRIVEIVPGIKAALPAYWTELDHNGYDVEVVLDMDSQRQLRARSVTVSSREGQASVDGTTLRKIKVGEIVQNAISNILNVDQDRIVSGGVTMTVKDGSLVLNPAALLAHPLTLEEKEKLSEQGGKPNDSGLRDVATLFRAAQVSGIPPQRYIMDAFNLPRSTAGYWISQARKRGFLEPSSRAKSQGS